MKRIRYFGLIDQRAKNVDSLGDARCVLPPAHNASHVEVAVGAECRQVFRALVLEPLVGAMMHLELGLLRACVAEAAAHAGGRELCKSRRVIAPIVALDVAPVTLEPSGVRLRCGTCADSKGGPPVLLE